MEHRPHTNVALILAVLLAGAVVSCTITMWSLRHKPVSAEQYHRHMHEQR